MVYSGTELLQIALKIELNGELFYKKAAKAVNNDEVKKLFEHLASEETRHAAYFKKLRQQLESKQVIFYDTIETDMLVSDLANSHVFKKDNTIGSYENKLSDANEAIKLALQFENDTIAFFNEMGKNLSGEAQETVHKIIEEEKLHIRKLKKMQ